MIRYKLTDKNGNSRGGMHWAPGITNRATGTRTELCTDGFIHGYKTPEQAAFMRPSHVPNYTRLWEIEVPEVCISDGTKEGYKEATCIREISLPTLTPVQCTEIAIRVSLLVYKGKSYVTWAKDWLSGKDRSENAAHAAVSAAVSAESAARNAWSAAGTAAGSAERAAGSAERAAVSAAHAAWSAAGTAAGNAAVSAESAAWSAAGTAAVIINLAAIIKEVLYAA